MGELTGLLTGANEVLQNIEKTSTGLVTISQRIRGIEEAGDESIAKRVIQTSRELYAKKAEPEEEQPSSKPKQNDAAIAPKKPVKPKKKRPSKKSNDDELSVMKSVT